MTPLLPLLLLLSSAALALNPIVVKGNLFFDSVTGGQFWARGVGYQPKKPNSINYDVLADQATIDRDLPYLINLGVNCIRVYETYATENHDYAMGKLEAAGIYVMLDVPTSLPGQSIDTNSPAWNQDLFEVFKAKVDAFSKYTNVLAYIASNEVSNQPNNTAGSAFVKAAVRDVKAYVRSKSLTTPVGYAIADAGSIVADQESYFACGDAASTPDFYGINIYRWCGNSSYTQSGYDTVTATFTNWPIAVLFSEYGCNIVRPRLFSEVNALYGSQMSSVFSGGIVYEYSQEENNYGLVQINFNNNTVTDIDFSNYKQRLTEINPTGTTMSAYTPTPKTITCPTVQAGVWEAVATPLPPAINEDYCACVLSSLTCRANATSAIDLIANRTKDVVSAYGYVCGLPGGYCADISANAKTGDYGGLSMCDALVRVSAVMNNFYMAQTPVAATNCAFNGLGKIQTPSTTMATCRSTYSISSSTVMTSSSTTGTGTGTASTTGSTTASTTGTGAGTGSTTTGGSTTTTRGSETSTSNTRGTSVNDESSANMLAATFTLLFLALFL